MNILYNNGLADVLTKINIFFFNQGSKGGSKSY